jgi:hypothetical protein
MDCPGEDQEKSLGGGGKCIIRREISKTFL